MNEVNTNWYLGIKLDNFSKNKRDKIEQVDFYNLHNQKTYSHFETSYTNKEEFKFLSYQQMDFKLWKSQLDLCIPLSNQKFNQMKGFNTVNHKSLKKFLKAFGFDEYLI